MNVILLGPPGAGKGTQGERLAERFGATRIATGDLLREAVRRGSSLGTRAKKYMDAGELVPDDVILGLVRDALESSDSAVFDGFPRNEAQAEALDDLLEDVGQRLSAVVVIDVPDDVLVKRISGRRSCSSCDAVYNVHFSAPAESGVCDECGGDELVERTDDDAETVRKRLAVYREQTEPLIKYYQAGRAPVVEVDGDRPIEDVHADIVQALDR